MKTTQLTVKWSNDYTHQSADAPESLVVDELEVVSLQVEQTADQGEEQGQGQGARVVGRPEHSYLHTDMDYTIIHTAAYDVYMYLGIFAYVAIFVIQKKSTGLLSWYNE